jgi:hypothetical protein
METSLHRQLKEHYAGSRARFEVSVDGYRIDVVDRRRLIEIQHGGLSAIRDKVSRLLAAEHRLTVVKPIVARKHLVKRSEPGGPVVDRRRSPKRGRAVDLFDELVHFTRVFPHRRLTLEVALVEVEEIRHPGHGRRRRWRESDFEIEDQRLIDVIETHRFRHAGELARLIPGPLPGVFDTADLAAAMDLPRWRAQRVAYCLRHCGAADAIGRRDRAVLYRWRRAARRHAA